MTRKRIGIEGMSCGHCVNHVKEALTEDIQDPGERCNKSDNLSFYYAGNFVE